MEENHFKTVRALAKRAVPYFNADHRNAYGVRSQRRHFNEKCSDDECRYSVPNVEEVLDEGHAAHGPVVGEARWVED